MLAFTINALYLISLLFVPNPPVEAKENIHCQEITAIVHEAVERGEISPVAAAEMLERCGLVEHW